MDVFFMGINALSTYLIYPNCLLKQVRNSLKICPASQHWSLFYSGLAKAKSPEEEKKDMTDVTHKLITLVLRYCGDECPAKNTPD